MIKTVCASCGNVRDFEEKYSGKKFKCPKCTTTILIEAFAEIKSETVVHPPEEKFIEQMGKVKDEYGTENKVQTQHINQKKSNSSVIISLFLIIIFGAIFYFTRSNNNSQSNSGQSVMVDTVSALKVDTPQSTRLLHDTLHYLSDADYYINARSDYRIYFYNYPSTSSTKGSYFESKEKVHVSKINDGFGYVEFINTQNEKFIGWIEMKELILIGKINSDTMALQSNNADLQANVLELDNKRKEIIIKHIEAEDNRSYSDIINFYSEKMERYYDINNPTGTQLQKRYSHLWGITNNPKSTIKTIEKVSPDVYIATFDFDYYGSKNNTHRTIANEVTYYKFDEANKIVSLYDDK